MYGTEQRDRGGQKKLVCAFWVHEGDFVCKDSKEHLTQVKSECYLEVSSCLDFTPDGLTQGISQE